MKYIILLLAVLVVGCGSDAAPREEILETLTISPDCENQDSCCESECIKFCKENGRLYTKHIVNGGHCPCWCD